MAKVLQGMPLKIDIVSDVVCPWGIIGYKQLQKALGFMPGQCPGAENFEYTRVTAHALK